MVTIFISLFVLVLSFNFFAISYQINGVNRLFIGMPMSIIETAIDLYEIDETNGPYFIKSILEDNVNHYFSFHMVRYTDDYDLEIYYYNPTHYSMCTSDKCHAVEITMDAYLTIDYHYHKTMRYEIWRN